MPDEQRPPMPDQPKTVNLPATTDRALLEDLGRVVRSVNERVAAVADDVRTSREETKADFALLAGQFESLENDVRGMQSWRVRVDDRLKSNSLRAQAPSSTDIELDAKFAQALVQLAEEKARADRLEATAATKAELKQIADAQTTDIVSSLEGLASRNKTVRNLLLALAALVFLAMNVATNYLTRPPPQPPQI